MFLRLPCSWIVVVLLPQLSACSGVRHHKPSVEFSAQFVSFTDSFRIRRQVPQAQLCEPSSLQTGASRGIRRQNSCRLGCNLRESHLAKGALKQQRVVTAGQTPFSIALVCCGSKCSGSAAFAKASVTRAGCCAWDSNNNSFLKNNNI